MIGRKSCGPPTRLIRWCCQIYKEQGGKGLLRSIGVRAPESTRRKGLWLICNNHNKDKGIILCPIVYWTDKDIWNYIREEKLEYCALYDEGFKRLGCVGCPMGNPRRDFERWPRYELLWKRAIKRYYDKFYNTPRNDGKERSVSRYETFDDYWNWWIEAKDKDDGNDCQLSFW